MTTYAARPRIVVVGSTNTDLVVGVDHIPAPGETILGGDLLTVAGGKGANQAVAAARMGSDVTFIARVGDDSFGSHALAGFRREGIDTAYVTVTPGVASGIALITIAEGSGQNAIVVAPGANAHLSPTDIDNAASAFTAADAVVVSLEVPLETVERAVALAHERHIPVILNPAPARPLSPVLLARVTVLTPNETEAALLATGSTAIETEYTALAATLLTAGVGSVVVTLGKDGALVATTDSVEKIPSPTVSAVDTVAAGDTFTGALAVGIASGRGLAESARFACAAAALKVTRRGAQPGIPTRAEVLQALAEGFGS